MQFINLLDNLEQDVGLRGNNSSNRKRKTICGSRPDPSPSSVSIPDEYITSEGNHEPLPFEIIHGALPVGDAVDMYSNPVTPYAKHSNKRSSEFDYEPGSGQPRFVEK